MLRSLIARAAMTALVASLLVLAAPSSSEAARDYKPWGTARSKNHVLERGCHRYTYRYRINAPNDQWSAEIFFVNPNGTGLASATLDTNSDPDKGKRRFTVCRSSTSFGKHKIRMKITYNAGRQVISGRTKPTAFRFTRP